MAVRPHARIGTFLSIVVCAVIACAALSACAQTTNPTNIQGPITIGLSLPLTGDFQSDGIPSKRGYELWADRVNRTGGLLGHPVQLDILNDNSSPQQATTDYETLISVHHDPLVLGPFGFETLPAAIVANRFHYAFVNGTGIYGAFFAQKLPNVFAVSLPSDNYFVSFANYILSLPQSQRPKTVSYVTANDDFTRPQVDVARQLLEQGGLTTSLYTTYPDETTDFTPIAQKAIQANAQVVVLGSIGLPDCLALLQAFKQQHYNPKAIIAATGPDQGDAFTKVIGLPSTEGIFVPNAGWFPGIKTYQNDIFTRDYIAKYGGTADSISSDTVQTYSAGQVLEQAIEKIHSFDNAKLIQELHSDTFQTLQGPVKFDAVGRDIIGVAYLFQWQKGQLLPVYPPNVAAANPEYPRPNWP